MRSSTGLTSPPTDKCALILDLMSHITHRKYAIDHLVNFKSKT